VLFSLFVVLVDFPMAFTESNDRNLFLRSLVLLGLILFGFFLGVKYGFVQMALDADRSYLSMVIVLIYLLATLHWLWLARGLTREADCLSAYGPDLSADVDSKGVLIAAFVMNLRGSHGREQNEALLLAFGDQLVNRHALGHFISDVLLRLGLLGTIIGFILMLMPVAEIQDFDTAVMQRLLAAMSGGMAVALYTTLAGLISSTLLSLQYHFLDTVAANLATRLTVAVQLSNNGASEVGMSS
jgi:hypothetical protein